MGRGGVRRHPRASLRVSVTDGYGRTEAAGGLGRWLASVELPRATGAVAVALVSDARMRALNRRYRGIDAVTDVLSFPVTGPMTNESSARELGDIVIAAGRAVRQARAAGHSRTIELRILALHGLLHLLGYDHERDAGRMAQLERRLRQTGGLCEGLIERGKPTSRRPTLRQGARA